MFGASTPLTVSNFKKNISDNIYRNSKFYKIVGYSNNKIIRGGIINHENEEYILSNETIPLEIQLTNKKEPIYSKEIDDPLEFKFLKNTFQKGSISMVKISKTKSSSTEFFISTQKSAALEGRYSVFGKVINGFEILENIESKDFILEIELNN